MKLQEENVERECEIEVMKEENVALQRKIENLEELAEKTEEATRFLAEKPIRVLVSGDSHLKCIQIGKLADVTGKEVSMIKTFCSRNFWPNALKPIIGISSVLLQQAKSRTELPTHLLMTSPTSDVSNLLSMGTAARLSWVDLSAKTMVITAEMCLIQFPGLQKVYIMEHLPR